MMADVDKAMVDVEGQIPASFPESIADPILAGVRKQRDRYISAGGL